MVEDTRLRSTIKDDWGNDLEEDQVETLARVPRGDNVRMPGSDVKAGVLVLSEGDLLSSIGGEIGTLAFVGKKEVQLFSACVCVCGWVWVI
jgi:gephyrin